MRHHIGRTAPTGPWSSRRTTRLQRSADTARCSFLGAARGVPQGSAFSELHGALAVRRRGRGERPQRIDARRADALAGRARGTMDRPPKLFSGGPRPVRFRNTRSTRCDASIRSRCSKKAVWRRGGVDYDPVSAAGDRVVSRGRWSDVAVGIAGVFHAPAAGSAHGPRHADRRGRSVPQSRARIPSADRRRRLVASVARNIRFWRAVCRSRCSFSGGFRNRTSRRAMRRADCYRPADARAGMLRTDRAESFAAGTPVIASRAARSPKSPAGKVRAGILSRETCRKLADRMTAFLEKRLLPTVDLHGIAREYDRPRVFEQWRALLLGDRSGDPSAGCCDAHCSDEAGRSEAVDVVPSPAVVRLYGQKD